jgi:hypothetical protein
MRRQLPRPRKFPKILTVSRAKTWEIERIRNCKTNYWLINYQIILFEVISIWLLLWSFCSNELEKHVIAECTCERRVTLKKSGTCRQERRNNGSTRTHNGDNVQPGVSVLPVKSGDYDRIATNRHSFAKHRYISPLSNSSKMLAENALGICPYSFSNVFYIMV